MCAETSIIKPTVEHETMQIVKALAESLETNLVESSAAAQKRDFLPNRNFNDSRFLYFFKYHFYYHCHSELFLKI